MSIASLWEEIESNTVQALQDLEVSGSPLLRTVRGATLRGASGRGATAQDRRVLVGSIARERTPAAYVVAGGRETSDKTFRRAGSLAFSVLLATRSERSDDEARRGGVDENGMFALAEQVALDLHDRTVFFDWRLLLVDEHPIGGEEGTIVWEQRYEARRIHGLTVPTFDGVVIAGSEGEARVVLGELRRASSTFSFPGIDGVYERYLGMRERPIVWRGQLRTSTTGGLDASEAGLENLVRTAKAGTIVDHSGRPHDNCVPRAYRRLGPTHVDPLTGQVLQDFELEFTQLSG